jgi:mannose-6-phosphate isomerase-like protein (cupin superfamily)
LITIFRLDEAAGQTEFGMACQRLLPWPGQGEEPPFGVLACFLPSAEASEPDCHNQDEVMIVLTGSGSVDVAGDAATLAAGDVVVIERNRSHVIHNTSGETLSWVSFYWPLHEVGGQP